MTPTPTPPAARADPRWPKLAAALATLRARHRHAVRIVDAECGAGTLLIEAVRHARSLGFTAIEGRGIDGSPGLIRRARAAARALHDPAIGIEFALVDAVEALAEEADFPADILLWRGDDACPATALAAAGDVVIGDAIATRRAA